MTRTQLFSRRGSNSLEQVVIFAIGALIMGGTWYLLEFRIDDKGASTNSVANVLDQTGDSQNDSDTIYFFDFFSDVKFLIFVAGAIFAFLAWTTKKIFDSVMLRAKLAIIEVLSDGTPREHSLVVDDVKRCRSLVRLRLNFFRGSITDALAELVNDGRVEVSDRKYSLRETKRTE